MKFTDAVTISGVKRRADGYLVADARVARIGIQDYAGFEVGRPDMAVARVYRPESEVFSKDTISSFAHRPITNDHPDEAVTSDNWKTHAVGHTVDEVVRDGGFIRVPLMVADGAAVKEIENGKRELSAGYSCDLDWTSGVTSDGAAYDAVQRNIRANHVAIVARGRAGSEVRIGDADTWGIAPITTDKRTVMTDALRTVVVDGFSVTTTDAGAQAIAKLQKDLATSATALTDAENKHQAALATKDAELAKKDAAIADLQGKVLTDAALDARVAARADLLSKARLVAKDAKFDGLADADVRRVAVVARLGDAVIKDRSEAYVDARFDLLVEDAAKNTTDTFRAVAATGINTQDAASQTNDAWKKSVEDMNSWRHKKEA